MKRRKIQPTRVIVSAYVTDEECGMIEALREKLQDGPKQVSTSTILRMGIVALHSERVGQTEEGITV